MFYNVGTPKARLPASALSKMGMQRIILFFPDFLEAKSGTLTGYHSLSEQTPTGSSVSE